LPTNRAAAELLTRGIERAGLVPGHDAAIAIDVAATQFASHGEYRLTCEDRTLTSIELVSELRQWCTEYPIVSLEDPLAEDDWTGWREITNSLADVQVIGDDLFVTDNRRLEDGARRNVANAILIKPNQCGTLTAASETVAAAKRLGYAAIVSGRSGDTEDTWMSDLAVGWRAGQIKAGSTTRSERNGKWNRLLQIEATYGGDVEFAGRTALAGLKRQETKDSAF